MEERGHKVEDDGLDEEARYGAVLKKKPAKDAWGEKREVASSKASLNKLSDSPSHKSTQASSKLAGGQAKPSSSKSSSSSSSKPGAFTRKKSSSKSKQGSSPSTQGRKRNQPQANPKSVLKKPSNKPKDTKGSKIDPEKSWAKLVEGKGGLVKANPHRNSVALVKASLEATREKVFSTSRDEMTRDFRRFSEKAIQEPQGEEEDD